MLTPDESGIIKSVVPYASHGIVNSMKGEFSMAKKKAKKAKKAARKKK